MPKKAKPAVRSVTMWGAVVTAAAVTIPIVQQRLATGAALSKTEWVSLGLGFLAAVMVAVGRSGAPAPVRGLFSAKE